MQRCEGWCVPLLKANRMMQSRSLSSLNANSTMQKSVFIFAERQCDDAKVGLRLRLAQSRRCRGRSLSSLNANATMQRSVCVFAKRKIRIYKGRSASLLNANAMFQRSIRISAKRKCDDRKIGLRLRKCKCDYAKVGLRFR